MKKLLLIVCLLSFSALFAQKTEITLPEKDVQTVETDFYFRDVVYKLPADQPVGSFLNESDDQLTISLGPTPEENIKNHLNQKYPPSDEKTALILTVTDLKLTKIQSNTGDIQYKSGITLKFFILNGDMRVILGTGKAEIQQAEFNPEKLVAEAIEQAITNFDATNWQEHPLIGNRKLRNNKEAAEEEAAYPRQKSVYTVSPSKERRRIRADYNANQFSISAGYSYRIAEVPNLTEKKQEELINGLRHGMNVNISYSNYFNIDWGLGLLFNYSFASSSVDDYPLEDENDQIIYLDVEENISVGFVGPIFSARRKPDDSKKFNFHSNFGLGYVFYTDEVNIQGSILNASGNTLGLYGDVNLAVSLSPNSYIMLKAGFLVASLSSMEIGGRKYELEENENLSRTDINLGIGFNF